MESSALSDLGVVLSSSRSPDLAPEPEANLAASERESRQRLWWFLLLALLALLAAETWIANQTPATTGTPAQA